MTVIIITVNGNVCTYFEEISRFEYGCVIVIQCCSYCKVVRLKRFSDFFLDFPALC